MLLHPISNLKVSHRLHSLKIKLAMKTTKKSEIYEVFLLLKCTDTLNSAMPAITYADLTSVSLTVNSSRVYA